MTPVEAVTAFIDASRAGNEAGAQRVSTAAGWASDGDGARRASKNLRKDILFSPLDIGTERGDRYILPGLITSADRQKLYGDLYFLLLREGDTWRVEGAVKVAAVAGLFAAGLVSGVPSWRGLPESPDARKWAEDAAARLGAGQPWLGDTPVRDKAQPKTRTFLDDCIGRTGTVVGAVECAPLQRAMAGLSFPREGGVRPDERWMIFDRDGEGGALVLHSHSPFGSLEAFLAGAEERIALLALTKPA